MKFLGRGNALLYLARKTWTALPCLELGIAPAAQINCSYSSREPKERQSYQMFACFNEKPQVTAHTGGVYITFLLLLLGNTLHCVLLNFKKPSDLSIFSLWEDKARKTCEQG